MNTPQSPNNLPFESATWVTSDFLRFRIGTCEGLWRCTTDSYDILAIKNNAPGNGHLDDVFWWFEQSAKRDSRNLRVLDLLNPRFETHLLQKRGFVRQEGTNNVIKQISP